MTDPRWVRVDPGHGGVRLLTLDRPKRANAMNTQMGIDLRQVFISGTAAIDEKGVSLFPEDARAQLLFTMDAIEALLKQEGGSR